MTHLAPNDAVDLALQGGLAGLNNSFSPSNECLALASHAHGLVGNDGALLAAFTAENADTRALALTLSIFIHGSDAPDAALARVLGVLKNDPQKVAALGAMSLISLTFVVIALDTANWGSVAISSALMVGLDDPVPVVRGRAAFALGAIGATSEMAVEPLLRMLREEPSGAAVAGAALGLTFVIDESLAPVIAPRLRESARADPDWQVRGAANWVLGMVGLDDPIGLRDIDDRVKGLALGASAGAHPVSYRPEILRIVRDGKADPSLRLSAACSLTDGGDPELIETGLLWLTRYRAEESFWMHYEIIDVVLALHGRTQSGNPA
ncbi:hypothetical protein C3B59_17390 [Cryobacterium zongtaii]|uniref:HEAT repeat domain-containing protein n=1 Tax=Cryobacterium zongtaii TaxID=1259217 RepID=A0A2S3Z617_9MICO|nr:HEAT repeat domain-containing protein [Cryobacterium zongtaii]POH59666.1 hypothetical protein C3B59_17390 [Cryobacterium zongtaii]